jgi:hypothetical protein
LLYNDTTFDSLLSLAISREGREKFSVFLLLLLLFKLMIFFYSFLIEMFLESFYAKLCSFYALYPSRNEALCILFGRATMIVKYTQRQMGKTCRMGVIYPKEHNIS